jgi:hypothetical protein
MIDINGLSVGDQNRIREVGLSAWIDEISNRPKVPTPSTVEIKSGKPKRTWRNCSQCDKPFLAKRSDARLCSQTCRRRATRGLTATDKSKSGL